MKLNNILSNNASNMIKAFFTIFSISVLNVISNAQFSDLPLVKGHAGGDTTVEFSHTFTVHGRIFTPVTNITVTWDESDNEFSVIGMATAQVNGTTFKFNMGDTDSYFTLNGSSTITTYIPNVVDTFQLAGQKFIGLADETHFTYNSTTGQDNFYGDVKVVLDGKNFAARMGSSDDPGAILSSNNPIKVWVHINDLVNLKGLTSADLSKTDIILRHLAGDPANTYYGYGTWAANLMEVVQLAFLGTGANPGMVVKNSQVDSVKMTISGGGVMFGVLPVIDGFKVEYDHDAGKYKINGIVNVGVPLGGLVKAFGATYAPSFVIDASDDSKPGFYLNPSNGKFEVENAIFSLKTLNGAKKIKDGGFQINYLDFGVKDSWPDSISGSATFPPGISFAIGASFNLKKSVADPYQRFFINSLSFDWTAANVSQAIPLGTTGFKVVTFGGAVDNLLDLENLSITGDIGLVFGEPVVLDLKVFHDSLSGMASVSVVYVEGLVNLSTHGVYFQATGDLGSIFTGGHWQGLIAELEGGIDIKWSGTVNLDASFSAWVPPYDVINATTNISFHESGDIDATGKAVLHIPKAIPVFGGYKLANTDFAVRYKKSDIHHSYAAGWSKFNLGFDHVVGGIKANFKTGKITKVGAAAARALTHDNISDPLQHPIGPNGEPDNAWYACGITQHWTLPTDIPPAYLQNQMVINNFRFENPLVQHQYWSPAVATITSPSSNIDLKVITPSDSNNIYFNQGQTTPQDNTMSIDFTMNFVEGGSDTINWVIANQAAESYSSIDWIHQPELMLTPGEYVLTLSGYCNIHAEPLETSDMKYNVSPVYPRPTINLAGDGNGNFTIDYSSYITDSTSVSLYWNYEKDKGGNLIGHLPYHEGVLVGDSMYQWIVENWFPGIIAEEWVYFYAVIDDHINNPVQSNYDSIFYRENLKVNVHGGDDSTTVVLSPADTTLAEVYGINNGSGTFIFGNVPLGEYSIHCYSNDTTRAFSFNYNISGIDGNVISRVYHTPEWVTITFDVVTWDNGIGEVYFYLEEVQVPLFGEVVDTAGASVGSDSKVYLLDAQNNVVAQTTVSDVGYWFADVEEGFYRLVISRLPTTNDVHWASHDNLQYVIWDNGIGGVVYIQDSVELTSVTKAINYRLLPGAQGPIFLALDYDGQPTSKVVITIHRQDGMGPLLQAVTNEHGLAFFDAADVATWTSYIFNAAWPDGYHAVTPQGQTFQWTGTTDPHQVLGQLDE